MAASRVVVVAKAHGLGCGPDSPHWRRLARAGAHLLGREAVSLPCRRPQSFRKLASATRRKAGCPLPS